MEQVCGAVISTDRRASFGVDGNLDRVSHANRSALDGSEMNEEAARSLCIENRRCAIGTHDLSLVSDLATGLAIAGCSEGDDFDVVSLVGFSDANPIFDDELLAAISALGSLQLHSDKRSDFTLRALLLVANELGRTEFLAELMINGLDLGPESIAAPL